MKRIAPFVVSLMFVVSVTLGTAHAKPINFEISGMTALPDGRSFVTVLDTKVGPDSPFSPRAGVLRVSEQGVLGFQPFGLTDWGPGEEAASDLEACCAIPGRPNEYLLAESGYYKGRFGRVFHVRIASVKGSSLYTAEVLGSFKPDPLPSTGYSTPGPKQFEGIACLENGDEQVVILGRRGGDGEPGGLLWGSLSFPTLEFTPTSSVVFDSTPEDLQIRGCADLMLVEREGKQVLLRVASSDPADFGPFYSFILESGEFHFDDDGKLQYEAFREPVVWWHMDGLKVEALAPCSLGEARYCVGTDDEVFGGAWRPLGPPRPTR